MSEASKFTQRHFWPLFGVVVVVAVVFGILAFTGEDSSEDVAPYEDPSATPSATRDVGNEGTARIMCEKFVKARLKAPSTAEFSDTKSSGKGPDYSVSGAVDSENSLGAPIRNDYRCLVRYDGDSEWDLVELNGLDQ